MVVPRQNPATTRAYFQKVGLKQMLAADTVLHSGSARLLQRPNRHCVDNSHQNIGCPRSTKSEIEDIMYDNEKQFERRTVKRQ